MVTGASCLNIFIEGVAQLLAPLTDDIDDTKATTTIRFALQAVGTDAAKLQSLVKASYDKATPRDQCSARLFVNLQKIVPDTIVAVVSRRESYAVAQGAKLVRYFLLRKCQADFDLGRRTPVWPTKPIAIVLALWQADSMMLVRVIGDILKKMTEAKHLFEPQTFDEFARFCMACGPRLDRDKKDDNLTECINRAWARATSESIRYQLMIAGLVATRENAWEIQLETGPQVLTPAESEDEVEVEVTVKTEEGTEG